MVSIYMHVYYIQINLLVEHSYKHFLEARSLPFCTISYITVKSIFLNDLLSIPKGASEFLS